MCSEMHRWTAEEISHSMESSGKKTSLDQNTTVTGTNVEIAGQPLFETVVERLKTSYRLACFEETSYADDDIFSEAIWSTPNQVAPSQYQVYEQLRKRFHEDWSSATSGDDSATGNKNDGLSFCDYWLTCYESNADIRGMYRHAILRIINAIDDPSASDASRGKGESGYANALSDLYVKLRDHGLLSSGNAPDTTPGHSDVNEERSFEFRSLGLMCHMTSMAVACHEIHQGRPASVFQIGGRQKLISLTRRIADDVNQALVALAEKGLQGDAVVRASRNVVSELMELKNSTFQGSEPITAISFAQCVVLMLGEVSRSAFESKTDDESKQSQLWGKLDEISRPELRKSVKRVAQRGRELALTRVRIGLHQGLLKSRPDKLMDALLEGWSIAFFDESELEGFLSTVKPKASSKKAELKRKFAK